MKATFYIDYRTEWGQVPHLNIIRYNATPDQAEAVAMELQGQQTWSAVVDIPDNAGSFRYFYTIVDADSGSVRRHEYGEPRLFEKNGNIGATNFIDRWHDMPADAPMYSSLFTDCICRRDNRMRSAVALTAHLSLAVEAPQVPSDCTLAVTGNIEALGNWDPEKGVRLSDADFPLWRGEFPLKDELSQPLEYKFVVLDSAGKLIAWETGENRRLSELAVGVNRHNAVDCPPFRSPFALWRSAGTAIPVFSIRTDTDFGVGDFHSLLRMIDWCAATGQHVVQLLPVNDTTMTGTWQDSYPYNANSTFALHPMYLHLPDVGQLKEEARRRHYQQIACELNALPAVDYERVTRTKDLYARELFAESGKATLSSDEFKSFYAANREWLMPYAAFRILRDRYDTPDMSQWGEYAIYNAARVTSMIEASRKEYDYHCFVQYHLHRQMRAALEYAHTRKVAIKGDIPIGISRNSADAWQWPHLFDLDSQAGAPPDAFSVNGQNWGFPTYNWEVMARDGYAWWKERFRKMSEYFDAYRIDHVLGFFRIWQIPMDAVRGLLGVFAPALPLSVDEMRNSYDFTFRTEYARPQITDALVDRLFGDNAQQVRELYLMAVGGIWHMKPEVDTQRKIATLFATLPPTAENAAMANALMSLLEEVLFIEDKQYPGMWHPRIAAQQTAAYEALDDNARWCFNRLYNDFFYHRHNDFWAHEAMRKLPPLIDATRMLVCAEDLGMIPACVPDVMRVLHMLSLEIQRMPKNPGTEFADPARYPYLSVCTTSTHDMSGIRGWWTENPAATQRFYNDVLRRSGEAPADATPEICRQIIGQQTAAPSMLCILPLQDWLSTDTTLRRPDPTGEQINVPANPRHYWRYRMHLTVEQLLAASAFNAEISSLAAR